MYIDFLTTLFQKHQDNEAVVWHDEIYTYRDILKYMEHDFDLLKTHINGPLCVAVEGDFSPHAISLLLCLIELNCIIVPMSENVRVKNDEFKKIAEVEASICIRSDDSVVLIREPNVVTHPLLLKLKEIRHPGLILFSSGTTGKSKASVHDFLPLLEKFKRSRQRMRMIAFLLFDHMGGVNTILYALSNVGCIITLDSRRPIEICRKIEKYRAEVLPASPTFLNLLMLSGEYAHFDLSSLRLVTYGTETMPASILARFHALFPNVRLLQTYGLTEVGVLRSKSKASDSLWVKIGGEDFQTRIVDGMLEIKAKSAMIGYLNAESPFTNDGWFRTGDAVEQDGEYIKLLGRKSEMINMGGQKVFPAEVESVLQEMDGVEEAVVFGKESDITGQIVAAYIKLSTNETRAEFQKRMRIYCKERLEKFKIPSKIILTDSALHSERFKKTLNRNGGQLCKEEN